ncbi:outer membrane protein assembly factor BamB [Streptomyces aurantiacus]|uniref:serine/threonine-protein kinase n=1 Tax=Streptomyces aurantiacus TaxID=47760 RepID=UPI00279283A5|nr:serine/threonine-protein kinase [Streptomyces aurantiacus]MDQ0776481.1 outer membrane protein assembly factor BamB [Streptomyces aurantiacus]
MAPLRSFGAGQEAEHPDYAGQYRLESCLGAGGMGVVHLATSASGLRLAIKVVHAQYAADPEFRARFRQEVSAARRVSGAFTAPVVDADPNAELPWMATLFIPGPTLAEQVKRNGAMEAAEVRRLGAGLAEALRDIHRAGVVHRDLKPSNVLLAPDGPKVIDFGISRPTDSDVRTETGKLIGSPPFMAPEQFQRPREVGPAADVFAMGAVLAHAATGRGPFDSNSPYIVAYQVVHNEPDLAGVPDDLVPLILRCLAKDPAERPLPAEVMDALRQPVPAPVSASTSASAPRIPAQRRPPGPPTDTHFAAAPRQEPEPVAPPRSRRRLRRVVTVGGVAGAVLALVAAGAFGIREWVSSETETPSAGPAKAGLEDFRPWSTALDSSPAAREQATPPVCTSGGGALYCSAPGVPAARLDPANGRIMWSYEAEDAPEDAREDATDSGDGSAGAKTPPELSGGLLHLTSGDRLQAVDPRSGKQRWDVDISAYASVVHGVDTTLLVGERGAVRALDSATGKERWSKQIGGLGTQWIGGPAESGVFYAVTPSDAGTATEVSAVSAERGAVLWTRSAAGNLSPFAAPDGALYLLSTNADQLVDAIVRFDSGKRSARRVALPTPLDRASAAESGGVVYLSDVGGSLVAVDTRRAGEATEGNGTEGKGAELWRLETSVSRPSRPVVSGGHVYVSAPDGRLLATDARDGDPLGQTRPRLGGDTARVVAELPVPVVMDAKIFAGAPDGRVFALTAHEPADW